VACVPNSYSLFDRRSEDQLELCRRHGIAWVPFFPLGTAFPQRRSVTDRPEVRSAAAASGATAALDALARCAPASHPSWSITGPRAS
jgi:aryl-alcohol dehydrogenase-like predicted oxidoreductase